MQIWRYRDHRGEDHEVMCAGISIHSSGALVFWINPAVDTAKKIIAPGRWIDCTRIDEEPEGSPIALADR